MLSVSKHHVKLGNLIAKVIVGELMKEIDTQLTSQNHKLLGMDETRPHN